MNHKGNVYFIHNAKTVSRVPVFILALTYCYFFLLVTTLQPELGKIMYKDFKQVGVFKVRPLVRSKSTCFWYSDFVFDWF